jgi:hypothetical protein
MRFPAGRCSVPSIRRGSQPQVGLPPGRGTGRRHECLGLLYHRLSRPAAYPLTDLAKTVEAMLVQIDYFGDVEAIPAPAAMLQSSSIAGTVKN